MCVPLVAAVHDVKMLPNLHLERGLGHCWPPERWFGPYACALGLDSGFGWPHVDFWLI